METVHDPTPKKSQIKVPYQAWPDCQVEYADKRRLEKSFSASLYKIRSSGKAIQKLPDISWRDQREGYTQMTQRQVLDILQAGPRTIVELCTETGKAYTTIMRQVNDLKADGAIYICAWEKSIDDVRCKWSRVFALGNKTDAKRPKAADRKTVMAEYQRRQRYKKITQPRGVWAGL